MFDIFMYPFFQRALLGGILIGMMAPMIGVYIVLKRLSMIGDTLAHVTIAGVALGVLIHWYPPGMGLLFAVLAAFAIEKLRRSYRSYAELSLAIMLSGGIALASVFFSLGQEYNMNVSGFLFGNILSLGRTDLWLVAAVTLAVAVFVLYFRRQLFLITFDEEAARVSGLNVSLFNMVMIILTGLVISVAIKIAGALLVSALLTLPAACSLVFRRGFQATIWTAVLCAEFAVVTGLSIAGLWGLAPGGTIVLLLIGMLIVLLLGRKAAGS